jgi:hypothetical protein
MRSLLFCGETRTAHAQRQPFTVAVISRYAILGPSALDTAAARRAFVAGLVAESVAPVLPPFGEGLSAEQRREALAERPAAQFGVILSFSGTAAQSRLEIRATDITTTQDVFRASLDLGKTGDLSMSLDSLGRRLGQQLLRYGAPRVRRPNA